jgi:DNA-binding NarL/FixJ family response regulator
MNRNIRVLLAENDIDFVYLIRSLLEKEEDIHFLGYASSKTEAVKLAGDQHPDIVLMDLNLTGKDLDGIEAAKEIRLLTEAKVIILTSFENFDTVVDASVKSFASGYVFKSNYKMILQHIRSAAKGHTPEEYYINSLILNQLTAAEKGILTNLLKNDYDIYSSNKTVANQKTNIFRKLGLKNQKELKHIFGHLFD